MSEAPTRRRWQVATAVPEGRQPMLVDRFGRWLTMEWRDVLHLDRLFERYGQYAVFIFRFMPVFRTMGFR